MKGFQLDSPLLRDIYLIIVTGILFLLFINLFTPFLTSLLIALLLVALFQPLFKRIEKHTNNNVATLLSTIAVVLVVVIPIVIMVFVVAGEMTNFTEAATKFLSEQVLADNGNGLLVKINDFLFTINPSLQINATSFRDTILSVASTAGNTVSILVLALFQNIGGLFAQFIVFIIAIALIFKDYEKIPAAVKKYVPLDSRVEDLLINEFINTGKGVIKGTFLVSLLHATGITLIMYLFGVQALGVIFLLVFLASMIPGGSQIVWVPAGIIVGLGSGVGIAILLLILCFVVMNGIDTIIRPALTSGGSRMHPLLSLVSILGGLIVYGVSGLLYGPLIAVLFVTIISAYNRRFKQI